MDKLPEPYYQTEDGMQTIYCGDSLELLPLFEPESVDLVLTDPNYNAKDIGPHKRVYGVCPMQSDDYPRFCSQWFELAERVGKAVVFTPGIANTHYYPAPFWQICWHKPAAVSFNRMGGFNAWEPIFTYGDVTKAKLGQDYILCNTLNLAKGPESGHPCPKPLSLILQLIEHFSLHGETILDPFMGSGTTLVACQELGRRGIGIEIEEKYCEIAKKRLRQMVLPGINS